MFRIPNISLISRVILPTECYLLCSGRSLSFKGPQLACRRGYATAKSTNPSTPARVRFAPSPTGQLHLGGLRTALFNYLLARKTGGSFILRIEDTDQSRLVPGAVDHIQAMLKWAGLEYDEGPKKDGPLGPYFQSQRLQLYRDHAQQLLDSGKAYRCFCSAQRLEKERANAKTTGRVIGYDGTCSHIPREDSDAKAKEGIPHTIRLKVPPGSTTFKDIVYGPITFQNNVIDDSVLLKSDGWPTYHLANVVDDHMMEITHIMRGEEWITSTPKHIILYEAFGWKPPQFAHLPLLHNPDRSKLSKRHGDVHVEMFKEKGYLPSAVVNFVAWLGWGPEGIEESGYMTLEEMAEKFDLSRLGNSGTVVAYEKLDSLNKIHLAKELNSLEGKRRLLDQLKGLVNAWDPQGRLPPNFSSDEYLTKVLDLVTEKITVLSQVENLAKPFFVEPDYAATEAMSARSKLTDEMIVSVLRSTSSELGSINFDNEADLKASLHKVHTNLGIGFNQLMVMMRWAISGNKTGAGLVQMLQLVGKERTLARLQRAVESIKTPK